MSLRNKKNEIKRLISYFELEAEKFHDITFSVYYISDEGLFENRKFKSPNHTIMLWQYYGKLDPDEGAERLLNDLKKSDFCWGIKGANLSAFAVIEGNSCNLFARMAKRAGHLFSEKESSLLKSRILEEIQKLEMDGVSKPISVTNSNELAIWLNYLLYYISRINPGKEKLEKIDPDPFSLSLLALEDLLENPKIEKIDKSFNRVEFIKFKVAVSFPGKYRTYVSKVVDILRNKLGEDRVFYDYYYQSQLARPNMDTILQKNIP